MTQHKQRRSNKKDEQKAIRGALTRIFATPDGAVLAGYMTGVIIQGSYRPGASHVEMIHIEGQRTAFRQLLSLSEVRSLDTNIIMESVAEGADNE